MSNQDRVMTLRITIKDPEAAKWLWDAHKSPVYGITVNALANGDLFEERDELYQAAEFFICEDGEIGDAANRLIVEIDFGDAVIQPHSEFENSFIHSIIEDLANEVNGLFENSL